MNKNKCNSQEQSKLYTTTDIACQLHISVHTLYKFLVDEKIITRQQGYYDLTPAFKDMDFGAVHTVNYENSKYGNTGSRQILKWTEKGRELVHRIYYSDWLFGQEGW